MSGFALETPRDGHEIRSALAGLEREITGFLAAMPIDEFLAPQDEAWAPEAHLRHLAKSVRSLAEGMRMPRILLALRFGRPRRPSRSYDEVVAVYRAALAAGADAGRYTPSPRADGVAPEEWRSLVLGRWGEASARLASALERWDEAALDRYQAVHPLLGKMTVRELLFFTLYHNAHHARRIAERRKEPAP